MQIKRVEPVYKVSTSVKYNKNRSKGNFQECLNKKEQQGKKGKR